MLLSVITFGLLGFASMPKHGHVPKDVASKPEGKCACGTYPLYLTEAEAGNSMCQRMLKWPALVHDSATAPCNPPLSFRSGPGLRCAVRCSPRPERSLIRVSTFRCHVFSGTNYYMGKSGTHGTSADYSCPAGMTDVVANSADCGVLVMCSGTPAGTHTGHG